MRSRDTTILEQEWLISSSRISGMGDSSIRVSCRSSPRPAAGSSASSPDAMLPLLPMAVGRSSLYSDDSCSSVNSPVLLPQAPSPIFTEGSRWNRTTLSSANEWMWESLGTYSESRMANMRSNCLPQKGDSSLSSWRTLAAPKQLRSVRLEEENTICGPCRSIWLAGLLFHCSKKIN